MANLAAPFLGIRSLIREYGITAVVETGCGHGASMLAVIGMPVVYFGCDVDKEAVLICKEAAPQAIVAQKDSVAFLQQLLTPHVGSGGDVIPPLDMPTLFWLDAHSFEGERGFPLLEEMETIAALKPNVERDLILCDDLRVIADESNPRFWPGELGAPYLRDEHPFEAYTNVFCRTHRTRIWLDGEGVLGFTPVLLARERAA